jgi:acyl-CoA synthetase (AMP-forming)/AMP-acid ligase II
LQPDTANIARHLPLMAASQPGRPAVKIPRGRTAGGDIDYLTLSFAELDAEVDAWVDRLAARGVVPGDRVMVMVRPGLPLIAAAFALFKRGAVPVIVDPGIGLKSFLACVARSRPRALLGIPFAQLLSFVFRPSFRSVAVRVWASNSPTSRLTSGQLTIENRKSKIENSLATDLAAILFTSGSTGAPKGVCYEHGMFDAQVRLIRSVYGVAPGEIDLPLLPVFALFNPALGMTTVVPELDPRRPASIDPARIVRAIQQEQVTNSFGSPTLWGRLFAHCAAHGIALPSLRRVLSAGAPVPPPLYELSRRVLVRGELHSPYGATEALPVSSITTTQFLADDVVRDAPRFGTCVGRPAPEIEVRIIAIVDGPLATFADARELPRGDIGEIVVRGPVVTRLYDALPDATARAKITDPSGTAASAPVWHRMGDCGRLDDAGRLWFCGRVIERVVTAAGTLFTDPCEQVFRTAIPEHRCALVGLGAPGQQRAALVIEADLKDRADRIHLFRRYRDLAPTQPHTAAITRFYFHPRFPVDARHNAKIHRLALARWAATARGYASDPRR